MPPRVQVIPEPPYEEPVLPLIQDDSSKLKTLHVRWPPNSFNEIILDAIKQLSVAASDFAEARRVYRTKETDGGDDEDEDEEDLPVDEETAMLGNKVEQKVRRLLDEAEKGQQIKKSLEEIGDAERRRTVDEEAVAPLPQFKEKMEQKGSEYSKLSAREKYTNVDKYIEYRQLVHTSAKPNTAMPRAREWTKTPLFGGPLKDEDEDDDVIEQEDDDIQVTAVADSLNCGITLTLLEDPVETPCKHHFSRHAIEGVLRQWAESQSRVNARNRRPFTCPTPGCSASFKIEDLKEDVIMQRRVAAEKRKRERETQRRADEEEEERSKRSKGSKGKSKNSSRRTIALDSDDSDNDGEGASNPATQIKRELSQRVKSRDSEVPTRLSQIPRGSRRSARAQNHSDGEEEVEQEDSMQIDSDKEDEDEEESEDDEDDVDEEGDTEMSS